MKMNLFKPDGIIYRLITKFSQLVLLSLMWLITSIPIVTAGAATAALYSVMFKILKEEDGHIVRQFFSYFKSNFRQATIAWAILLPLGAVIVWMYYLYFFGMPDMPEAADFFLMVIIIASVVYLITLIYTFACAARYENTPVQTIKNALFIGLRYIGRTVIILVIFAAVIFACLWNYTTMFIGAIFAPAFICYVTGSFQLKLFEKLEKERNDAAADSCAQLRIEEEIRNANNV